MFQIRGCRAESRAVAVTTFRTRGMTAGATPAFATPTGDPGSSTGSSGFVGPDPVSTRPAAIRLTTDAPDLRDFGGCRTADGHTVRPDVVSRADKLSDPTDAGLASAGVTPDVDLCDSGERAAAPDRVPTGARHQVEDVVGTENARPVMPSREIRTRFNCRGRRQISVKSTGCTAVSRPTRTTISGSTGPRSTHSERNC